MPAGVLSAALKTLAPAFNSKGLMPITDCVKMEVGTDRVTFTGTNLFVTISHFVLNALPAGSQPFTCVPDYAELRNVVANLSGDVILSYDNPTSALKITATGARFSLCCQPVAEFPPQLKFNKPVAELTLTAAQLNALCAVLPGALPETKGTYGQAFNNVLFEYSGATPLAVVATDKHLLLYHGFTDMRVPSNVDNVQLSPDLVRALKTLLPPPNNETGVVITDKNIGFFMEATVLACTLPQSANWPNWRYVVPAYEPERYIKVNGNDAQYALRMLSPITDTQTNRIYLGLPGAQPGPIRFRAENVNFSREAEAEVECTAQGVELTHIEMTHTVLSTALKYLTEMGSTDLLWQFGEANKPTVITSAGAPSTWALVMPFVPAKIVTQNG